MIEKILMLEKKSKSFLSKESNMNEIYSVFFPTKNSDYRLPCVIVLDEFKLKSSVADRQSSFLCLAGRVKGNCKVMTDKKLKKITADVCVFDSFARQENQYFNSFFNRYVEQAQRPLSREELIYHRQ
jgi:hypothetical protein